MAQVTSTGSSGIRICVYCGTHEGVLPEYLEAARLVGMHLARRGVGLVYGGGSTGMMGSVARACLASGGQVEGVVPRGLFPGQVFETELTRLHQVEDMHARKALMAARSDAFLALPGGLGTLEELFEALTWRQLGLHRRPVALLNVRGFYDPLLEFLHHGVSQGFIKAHNLARLIVGDRPETVLEAILQQIPHRTRA